MKRRTPRKRAPGAGRPREISKPYRLNLYVEADFVEELKRLSAFLSRKALEDVSVGRAITEAVRRSPQFRAMKRLSAPEE